MCADCTRLAAEIDLLALEIDVIQAETAVGDNWAGATRTLHAHEVTACVRFGELDRLSLQAAGLVARHADGVRQSVIRALLDDLSGLAAGGDPYAILARLQDLASPTNGVTLPLAQALNDATRQITETLAATQLEASTAVVQEARRQGVASAVLPDARSLRPTAANRQALELLARQVAEAPLARVLDVATREARTAVTPRTDPHAIVEAIRTSIEAVSPAGVEDLARQASTRAVNQGRAAAAEATTPPREVYASELLDSNTCLPCSEVDGRMYESLEAALVDYPSGGSYAACKGGSRCRGTLVFVWETEQAPSLDHPGDQPIPVHPIDRTPKGPATTQSPAVALPKAVGGTLPIPPPNVPPPIPPPTPAGPPTFKDLDRPETLAEATYSANPGWDPKTREPQFSSNCHQVVAAMEMRAQGHDVVALPAAFARGRYDFSTARDWVDPATGLPREFTRNSATARAYKTWLQGETASWPVGARGFISGGWKGTRNSGHIFNVEKTTTGLVLREGQVPKPQSDVSRYLDRMKPDTLSVLRVDDLVPSPRMRDSVADTGTDITLTQASKIAAGEARIRQMTEDLAEVKRLIAATQPSSLADRACLWALESAYTRALHECAGLLRAMKRGLV